MALLNDRIGECWSARAFFHGGGPSSQSLDHLSPIELFGYEEAGSVESLGRHYSSSLLPFVSDPSNSSRSSRQAFGVANSSSQDSLSVVDFKGASGGWCYSNSSLLRFTSSLNLDREDDCDVWIDAMDDQNYQLSCFDMKPGTAEAWLMEDQSFSEMEGDMPSPKKRCASSRMIKDKQSPSKDPHSVAAKNRRERIRKRLKILQDLVPNGTKVYLVTMLEKAINYVKFLQLQVKVLATDESWPAQGGEST